jgi:hypothetical protein
MSDPAYLKAFKELIRGDPTYSDLPRMEMEFYGESPRAVVLLSASLAELGLELALKKILRNDKSTADLFDFESPLGTFSGKAKLAFALKIFETMTRHDLELIRHLRNGFAHSRHPLTFETEEVAAVCRQLQLPDTPKAQVPTAYLNRWKVAEAWDKAHPKTRYVTACNTVAVALITYGRPPSAEAEMTESTLPLLP